VSFGNGLARCAGSRSPELNNHWFAVCDTAKTLDYVGTRKELLEGADTLFAAVINGKPPRGDQPRYAAERCGKGVHIDEGSRTPGRAIVCRRRDTHRLH